MDYVPLNKKQVETEFYAFIGKLETEFMQQSERECMKDLLKVNEHCQGIYRGILNDSKELPEHFKSYIRMCLNDTKSFCKKLRKKLTEEYE